MYLHGSILLGKEETGPVTKSEYLSIEHPRYPIIHPYPKSAYKTYYAISLLTSLGQISDASGRARPSPAFASGRSRYEIPTLETPLDIERIPSLV